MKSEFATIGVFLLIVGAALGIYWVNSPVADNVIAYGEAAPNSAASASGPPFYLAFNYTINETGTFTLSYVYGDANTTVYLVACAQLESTCSPGITPLNSTPIMTNTHSTKITGPSGSGTYTLPVGPQRWYVAVSNEPILVVAKIQATGLSDAMEYGSIALVIGGLALAVAGFFLPDPKRRPTPRIAQMKRTLYFFFQNKLAVLGLAILVFFVLVAIFAPVLAPVAPGYYSLTNPNSQFGTYTSNPVYCVLLITGSSSSINTCPVSDIVQPVCNVAGGCSLGGNTINPPSTTYGTILAPTWSLSNPFNLGPMPLGSLCTQCTSSSGGTAFVNTYESLIRATPIDLAFSGSIVLTGALIGIVLGAMAGYLGGYIDEAIMRITDIFLSIPQILLVIIILVAFVSAHTGFSTYTILELLILGFIVIWWPTYTRLVRGQVLVTREQKYVEAARASGAGPGRIIGKHIIPNSIYPVFVQMSLDVGTVPLLFGTLAYLGFDQEIGLQTAYGFPLLPEWGSLSAASVSTNSIGNILTATNVPFPWWQIVFTGLALFLFAIAVNFLADGLRDALDPRLRR